MKKFFSLLCAMCLCLSTSASVIASGDGWILYDNGELAIESSSVIYNYSSASAVPWHAYRNQVKFVHYWFIYDGVGAYMFCDMPNLKTAYFGGSDGISVGKYAFKNCPKLNDLGSSLSGVVSIGESAFENCTALKWTSPWTCTTFGKNAYKNCTALEQVFTPTLGTFSIGEGAFSGCTALFEIDLRYATTIGDKAFYRCEKLEAINLSSCMTIGKNAFEECVMNTVTIGPSIQSIDNYAFLGGFANGSHLYMESTTAPTVGTDAFSNYGTITLHLPDNATGYNKAPWTTEFINATTPSEIYAALSGTTVTFYYDDQCSTRHGTSWSTTEYYKLEIKNTATKIVIDATMSAARPTSMDSWFQNFKNVTKIENLSYLYTADVTEMSSLFFGCTSLTTIDINGLDMSSAQDIRFMFSQCTNLQKIYCEKDWSQMSNITNAYNMFEGCTSLVGGRGTAFDASHLELDYAHPDGGAEAPGYFWRAGDTGEEPLPFNPDEGIDQINNNQSPITNKTIKDGQLLILRGDKTYTIQGQEVK